VGAQWTFSPSPLLSEVRCSQQDPAASPPPLPAPAGLDPALPGDRFQGHSPALNNCCVFLHTFETFT